MITGVARPSRVDSVLAAAGPTVPGPGAPMIMRGEASSSIVATFEGKSRSRCHDYAFRRRLMILLAASRDAARRA
jgi:hypothetical protein